MSAIPLTLLTAAAVATALGGAALHTAHGVRRELVALRSELASAECAEGHPATTGSLPPHRRIAHASARLTSATAGERADGRDGSTAGQPPLSVSGEEIRAAVAEALAEERERELDEARAFWAAQEARGMEHGNGSLLAGHGVEYEISPSPSELEDALLDALADGRLDDHPNDEPAAPGDTDLPEPPRHEGEIFIPRQNSPNPFTPSDPGGQRGGSLPGPGAEPTEAGGAPAPGGRIPEPRTPGDRSGAPGQIPEGDRIPAERRRDGMRLDKRRGDERGGDEHRGGGHERPLAERRPLDPDGHPGREPQRNGETDGETTVPVQHPSRESAERAEDPDSAERDESSELAAARRRHPSDPNFDLKGERRSPDRPGGNAAAEGRTDTTPEHERTVRRLTELARSRVPLADVRPGPLGTLDVYLFQDGGTVCLSPGRSEVSQRLARALHTGDEVFLLGGSTVAGAFALTFSHGESETVYLLAERVIASP